MKKSYVKILAMLVVFVFGPFFVVWSLNTLFHSDIDYSFKTWLAVVFLSMAFGNTKLTLNG